MDDVWRKDTPFSEIEQWQEGTAPNPAPCSSPQGISLLHLLFGMWPVVGWRPMRLSKGI
jgi:hypothetical protein